MFVGQEGGLTLEEGGNVINISSYLGQKLLENMTELRLMSKLGELLLEFKYIISLGCISMAMDLQDKHNITLEQPLFTTMALTHQWVQLSSITILWHAPALFIYNFLLYEHSYYMPKFDLTPNFRYHMWSATFCKKIFAYSR